MKLSEKTEKFLNDACIKKFGITFQQMYNIVDQNEKMKEELKKKKKDEKTKCSLPS